MMFVQRKRFKSRVLPRRDLIGTVHAASSALTRLSDGEDMARKYSKKASKKVEKVMRERKRGTLRSGRSGRKVKSRKQAIAIGLAEARRSGAKVPKRRSRRKRSTKRRA
jgi:hypothetical protein